MILSDALDAATGNLEAIAEDAGISYDTLWAWKNGRRNPSPENLAKLADALERRGGELTELAKKLRDAGTEQPDKIARDDALGG